MHHQHLAHPPRRVHPLSASSTALGLLALLSACSADVQNMGENVNEPEVPPYSRCLDSASLSGDVVIENQDQLNALEGCQTIEGDLNVVPFIGADLRPLHALTRVTGQLTFSEPTPDTGWILALSEPCAAGCRDNPFTALYDAGWLESLEGLESLESVGGLKITGLSAASLAPLARLRTLTDGGLLHLSHCPNLVDLNGLENVTGVADLYVSCDNLETLAPLSLARQMNIVSIAGPKLVDLGSFDVRRVSGFVKLGGTGLENLDALSGLISVADTLYIFQNAQLQDMSGLDGLISVDSLIVSQNARLERFPALASLAQLNALAISSNATLKDLSLLRTWRDRPESGSALSLRPTLPHVVSSIELMANPELESFTVPFPWQNSGIILISGNDALRTLDLGPIETVDRMFIHRNPVLESVSLIEMSHADLLEVIGNSVLDTSNLEALATYSSTIDD